MRLRLVVPFLLILATALPAALLAGNVQETAKRDARKAAESWLAVVDSGKYADSWSSAAGLFQKAVTQEKWKSALQAARGPLGKLKTRTFKSATYSTNLPGAPDGEYVMLQYKAAYDHKAAAIETITPMREVDGRWRVAGYCIK